MPVARGSGRRTTLLPANDQGAARWDMTTLGTHHLPHEPPIVIQNCLAGVAAPGDGDVMPPAAMSQPQPETLQLLVSMALGEPSMSRASADGTSAQTGNTNMSQRIRTRKLHLPSVAAIPEVWSASVPSSSMTAMPLRQSRNPNLSSRLPALWTVTCYGGCSSLSVLYLTQSRLLLAACNMLPHQSE